MKSLCACGCKTRVVPRNNKGKRGGKKFASGHNAENCLRNQRLNSRGQNNVTQYRGQA